MALDNVVHHYKTADLARLLGLPDPCLAMGPLETLWYVTRRRAPSGAIGRMSNRAIADEMRWSGDPDRLVEALTGAGWLDEHPRHRLVVHDWHEHADDTTHSRLFRMVEYFWNGKRPRAGKCGTDEKQRILQEYNRKEAQPAANLWAQPAVVARQQQDEAVRREEAAPNVVRFERLPTAPVGSLPEPEPEPVPEQQEPPTPLHARGRVEAAEPMVGRRMLRKYQRALLDDLDKPGGTAVHQASNAVMRACGWAGDSSVRTQFAIVTAIRAECLRVHKPPEVYADALAEVMVANHRAFIRDGPLLKHTMGWVKFFEGGYSVDPDTWPWDHARLREQGQACVGMR